MEFLFAKQAAYSLKWPALETYWDSHFLDITVELREFNAELMQRFPKSDKRDKEGEHSAYDFLDDKGEELCAFWPGMMEKEPMCIGDELALLFQESEKHVEYIVHHFFLNDKPEHITIFCRGDFSLEDWMKKEVEKAKRRLELDLSEFKTPSTGRSLKKKRH